MEVVCEKLVELDVFFLIYSVFFQFDLSLGVKIYITVND